MSSYSASVKQFPCRDKKLLSPYHNANCDKEEDDSEN